MLVKIIRSQDDVISVELAVTTLKQILSGIELHYGKELIDSLLTENYRYILLDSANPDNGIAISPEVAFGSFAGFDMLVIVRDVGGEDPFGISLTIAAAAMAAGASAGVASAMGSIAVALINVALSFSINAVMSLLSPTPEFNKDPAKSQELNSNLFNGAVITREQGGIVPLTLGNPFCGGVLISSGMSTEDF